MEKDLNKVVFNMYKSQRLGLGFFLRVSLINLNLEQQVSERPPT